MSAIILIGMPGAGKSTLGVLLAKELAMPFIDTDILLQQMIGSTLQDFLDKHGYVALREQEEALLIETDFTDYVVSTGGSVVYGDRGMQSLKRYGKCLFLDISVNTLKKRVKNAVSRGLACQPGTSLEALHSERLPLYKRYADITITCDIGSVDEILEQVKRKVTVK